jgi:hypothetical protein
MGAGELERVGTGEEMNEGAGEGRSGSVGELERLAAGEERDGEAATNS